jgi:hypothetical protein
MSAEVERCLGALPPDQRTALQALRAIIARRLPGYPEVISYAMPGFRQPGPKGRMVAGYAAFKVNCGYYRRRRRTTRFQKAGSCSPRTTR